MPVEGRASLQGASEEDEGEEIGSMSLTTPAPVRSLQRKLYMAAKAEPTRRFHQLCDKVYRWDMLVHAYRVAKSAGGAPGVDGVTFEDIEAQGDREWLVALQEALRTRRYRPSPVRRVMIPKPGGGERPLGIPTIRDRVAQTAAKLVLEPIFEADFEDCAYGYRRSAVRRRPCAPSIGHCSTGTQRSLMRISPSTSTRSRITSCFSVWLEEWWIATCSGS